ncbi:MAG: MBL fold metallo-hydrolase [Sedimentisphaerales bacterium]|nr:MBL fold metallo-hydrolase [Sedimentisphaerales bacterium]
MFVQQFFVKGLAHSSYLLGGSKNCAIIDPQRDVDLYLKAAEDMGMIITHILETHLHADFVSGHLDLAEKTGAIIVAPKSAKCKFKHKAVAEDDTFKIENMHFKVLDTPGHTPEHITYVVTDKSRGTEPVCIFCGDVLFVGDVGRPDLFPGKAKYLASQLYDNLHNKIFNLPDFCEVYPAHGAGSLCGRAMGAKRTSTIGYERRYNSALQISNKEKFIESLTTNMPAAPDHFSRCSAINGKGPALVSRLPKLAPLPTKKFAQMMKKKNTIVLDIRDYTSFGGQHVPGAYHIDFGGNFATFAGWILPPDKDILLVANSAQQAHDANVLLKRVGLDKAVGFLDGGMFAWAKDGLTTEHIYQVSASELHNKLQKTERMILVDVRTIGEYQSNHIEGAVNIPAPELRTRYKELDNGKSVFLLCSTGHRSSLGASILQQKGFRELYNVAGGMTGYSAAGFSTECPMCVAPHLPLMEKI